MTRHFTLKMAMLYLLMPFTANAQEPARAQEPLTLERAVQEALARNPSLRASQSGSEAAAASARAVSASRFPRLSFTEGWQRGDQPVFVFSTLLASRRFAAANFALDRLNHPTPIGYFHGTAAIEQLLFDGGARTAIIDGARAQGQIAGLSAQEAALSLAVSVTELYGRLLASQAMSRATVATLDAGREDLIRATRRRDAGVATEADVLALRVHVADMEQRVIQADGDVAGLRAQLNRLMGRPIDRAFDAVEPAPAVETSTPALSQLLAEAASQRPDLARAAASERLADSARRRARAAYLPTAAAQAAFDVGGTRITDRAASWLVGGELRWSLGVGGGERAQMKAAAAASARARAEADDARAQAQVEVVTALRQVESARARQAVGLAAVAQARESQRIIRDRFDAGLAPVNDVLRAASAVLDADARRVSALVDQVTGAARLDRAIGRQP